MKGTIKSGKLGVRQRLGLKTTTPKTTPIRANALGQKLVKLYEKGMSAGDIGEVADEAVSLSSRGASSASSSSSVVAVKRLAKARAKGAWSNASRSLRRALIADSPLGPTYDADITTWDKKKNRKATTTMSFMPIHETLEATIPEGDEGSWCSIASHQEGFKVDLADWGKRVGVEASALSSFLPIALWGDAAEFVKGDSLFLLVFTILSGGAGNVFGFAGSINA